MVIQRVERTHLDAPQLDGPVEGGCDEVGGEVDLAGHGVTVHLGDRPLVAVKRFIDARFTAIIKI